MSIYDLERDQNLPGEELRCTAANLLSMKYGEAKLEKRACGKKTDIFFEYDDFGRTVKLYVEAKDHTDRLGRNDVTLIFSDYSGILNRNAPASLLIVSRNGITSDAECFVNEEQSNLRHQSIRELENNIFEITPYIRQLSCIFEEDGLNEYYIEARAKREKDSIECAPFIETVDRWLETENAKPLAILAGYGSGKTSFAYRLVSQQAKKALQDPHERRPILMRLGDITRATNLEGLLGAQFTAYNAVRGYNYKSFMELNQRGRFLIVLDGFDEMKHAMSWADFRTTVSDLNKLAEGQAKVILIGRPSAFISDSEHFLVLRGRKFENGDWRRVFEWLEYEEYQLEHFNEDELLQFIPKYLMVMERNSAKREGREANVSWIDERSSELSSIVKSAPEVLSRPVHARILVEIAADPDYDLSVFVSDGVSRWNLYEAFFTRLADRETQKAARKPISSKDRLSFLAEVAYYLWVSKNKTTNFTIDDISDDIFEALPSGDAIDLDSKKREYLSGSFLERKPGDIYFFPHRSFAEFQVAKRMITHVPDGAEHQKYSDNFSDGVEQFLKENNEKEKLAHWIKTLAEARCHVRASYIKFLATAWKPESEDPLQNSVWRPAFIGLRENKDQLISASHQLIEELKTSQDLGIPMAVYVWITKYLYPLLNSSTNRAKAQMLEIVCHLLERLFSCNTDPLNSKRIVVQGREAELIKDLLLTSFQKTRNRNDEKVFMIDIFSLRDDCYNQLGDGGIELIMPNDEIDGRNNVTHIDLPLESVLKNIGSPVDLHVRSHFANAETLHSVTVRQTRTKKFSIQQRRRKSSQL